MHRLRWIGISVQPFLVVREGDGDFEPPGTRADLRYSFLTEADLPALVELQPDTSPEVVRRWLDEGKLCFGVWHDDRLIAKMWCDLEAFSFPPNYRRLAADEAYLFAAYADPESRGLNVAPVMRSRGYDALRDLGRQRFCSYTDYFNTPARRFKAKLGAREESLRVHVRLFGRIQRTWTLRRYAASGS